MPSSNNLPVVGRSAAATDGMSGLSSVSTLPVEPASGVDWHRLLRAILRHKWVILATVILGTGAGVWGSRFVDPQYLVQSTLWIDQPSGLRSSRESGPIRSGQFLEQQASWVDLLKSYAVLDSVVRDLRLYLRLHTPADSGAMRSFALAEGFRPGSYRFSAENGKAWVLATNDGVELDHGSLGDSVGKRIGFVWVPDAASTTAERSVEFDLLTPREAARDLAERMNVRMDPEGNFLRVELTGSNPRTITAIVNAISRRYVEVAAALKKKKLTDLTAILDEQLQYAQRNLQNTEIALERFRSRTITEPADRATAPGASTTAVADPAFTAFFDQQLEREQVQHDRESLERWLAAPAAGRAMGPIEALESVKQAADLEAALRDLSEKQTQLRLLKSKYADDYQAVTGLTGDIATLRDRDIPTMVVALVSDLRTRETDLAGRIASAGGSLRQIPARVLEEGRLRRAAALAENVFTSLQKRLEENRIEEASAIPDVRVLDAAVAPVRPYKNAAPRVILLAFAASLGLAMTGAVVRDRLDHRVRYPEHVSRDLGLTILGTIPHVASEGRNAKISHEEASEVVEAFRGVCLNVVYALANKGPLVFTVTSPGAGDGKSFVSANLALSFSDGGHRTLLIDGDLRRGLQHRRFEAQRRPGLTDYLRGEVPAETVVEATQWSSLSLIPSGSRTHSAPALLGSPAMSELLSNLGRSYDVIILDSPPLTAGVDPFILSALAGHVMLVLRTGCSHRDLVAAKLEVMGRMPVRLLGAVLNDVPRGDNYQYYSYYLAGYEGVEEAGIRQAPEGA